MISAETACWAQFLTRTFTCCSIFLYGGMDIGHTITTSIDQPYFSIMLMHNRWKLLTWGEAALFSSVLSERIWVCGPWAPALRHRWCQYPTKNIVTTFPNKPYIGYGNYCNSKITLFEESYGYIGILWIKILVFLKVKTCLPTGTEWIFLLILDYQIFTKFFG